MWWKVIPKHVLVGEMDVSMDKFGERGWSLMPFITCGKQNFAWSQGGVAQIW